MNEFYNKMKYFEETDKIPAKIYYHYTSLDALFSIVKSKTFRLTSLESSNDKKELYYTPEEFLKDLDNVLNNEKNIRTKKVFKLIKESISLNKKNFNQCCKPKPLPYALCLSDKKDNLTHWDRYAHSCTGVCICFNISSLDVYLKRMSISLIGDGIYDIEKIFYSRQQKETVIKNSLVNFVNLSIEHNKKEGIDIKESLKRNGYIYAATIYSRLKKFSKNNSFVDEGEVRLYHDALSIKETLHLIDLMATDFDQELHTNIKNNFENFVESLHIIDENFCITQNGIRSYKNLNLEEVWGSGTIPEIILGPMCVQNKKELRRFLKANGLEGTKVTDSIVPIR